MKYIIGGNWKMNGLRSQGVAFLEEMEELGCSNAAPDVVLFPPFTIISDMAEHLEGTGIQLGGQDIFYEEKGAFTGEVSPAMLRDAGATWFIAGHSERRHVIGETDDIVRKKLQFGLEEGLSGILCVGELQEEREEGRTEEVVRRQVSSALHDLPAASADNLVIAYEPVWAIGTGLTATPEEAQRIHCLIREWAADIRDSSFADELRIQYGGSVKPGNAADILSRPDVNGALVGGASLQADSFMKIIEAAGY